MLRNTPVFLFILCVVFQSCTIQKRRYLKGLHIERWQAAKTFGQTTGKNGLENSEKVLDHVVTAPEIVNMEKEDSLYVPAIGQNKTAENPEPNHRYKTQDFTGNELKNHDLSQQNIPIEKEIVNQQKNQKTTIAVTHTRSPHGWGGFIFLIIALALLFPGLLSLIGDPLWLSILACLLWIAVDIFIILNAPTVLAMILFMLLWHVVYFFLFLVIFDPW